MVILVTHIIGCDLSAFFRSVRFCGVEFRSLTRPSQPENKTFIAFILLMTVLVVYNAKDAKHGKISKFFSKFCGRSSRYQAFIRLI